MLEKLRKLKSLKNMHDELKVQIEAIEDEVKSFMIEQNKDTLFLGEFKVTYKDIVSTKFDSKAFKEKYAKLYKKFSVEGSYKRLTVK